jgi:DNA-binding NtrC family response regulator
MSQTKSSSHDEPPVTVFVVDDEPMLLDLAAAILQPLGFNVRTFRDPDQAMKEISTAKPQVIVTDYAMGDANMNGMDVVRECRRINPRQKVILISGTVDEEIFADATVKPDRFIAKPYRVQDFVDAIKTLAAS